MNNAMSRDSGEVAIVENMGIEHADALLETSGSTITSDPRRALELGILALGVMRQHEDGQRTARALRAVGVAYLWLAEFTHAFRHLEEAISLSRSLEDLLSEARSLNALGVVHTKMGDSARALEQYQRSLELHRQLGDREGEAIALHNIGIENRALGNLEAAEECYEQALALDQEMDNQSGEARTLLSLGTLAYMRSDMERAIRLFTESLELSRRVDDRTNQTQALENLSEVEMRQGNYHRAIALLREGLGISRQLRLRDHEASLNASLGQTLRLKGNYKSALRYLNRAVALSQKLGVGRILCTAYREISLTCEAMNDYRTALETYRKYHESERLLLTEEAERKARTLSVRLEIEQARYEAERERRRALELEREVHLDSLTGIANRRYLMPRLTTALREAQQQGSPLAVAMLDVDHFKYINDRFSHSVGDIVLRHLGDLLQSLCREADVVARYGGEEFVMMMPGMSAETALACCEEVRLRVESHSWDTIHPDLQVTISIGLCASCLPETVDAILAIADERLYAAKNAGRNCVRSDIDPIL